jgi:ZIP family zinc transporter
MGLAIGTFLAGGLMFWQISAQLERRRSSASNLMGMLLDFIPEAIILGAAASQGSSTALLLALFIALQNMPEGFAALNEMRQARMGKARIRGTFTLAPLAGPLAAWFGYSCIDMGSTWLGGIMLFCSGGILYLIFQDIAPRAHLQHRQFPALGAVTGFLLGMTGTMLLH